MNTRIVLNLIKPNIYYDIQNSHINFAKIDYYEYNFNYQTINE